MKKFTIALLVAITTMAGPLFAADQILRVGMWADVRNLLDISTPSELDYVVKPYVEYLHGRRSTDNLTGGTYLSISEPYEIGTELNTIRPSVQSWLNYRFKEDQSSFMQTGLSLVSSQTDSIGTFISMNTYFAWYPYNKAKEVTVHQHFLDSVEGLRLGVGIYGGALVGQLLENADVTTDLNVGLSGILESGTQLSDHLWVHGYVFFDFLNLAMPSSFSTFEVSAVSQCFTSLMYVSEKLRMLTGFSTVISADKLLTQNGFIDGSSFNYSYHVFGEVGYFVQEDLFLYGGVELNGIKTSLFDNSNVYIGAQYFLL